MFQQCWLAKKMPRQFLENESKQKWCLNLLAAVVFFQKSPDHKSPSTGVAAFRSHSSIELQHDKISVKMKPGLWQRSQSKHEAAVFWGCVWDRVQRVQPGEQQGHRSCILFSASWSRVQNQQPRRTSCSVRATAVLTLALICSGRCLNNNKAAPGRYESQLHQQGCTQGTESPYRSWNGGVLTRKRKVGDVAEVFSWCACLQNLPKN